MYGYERLSISKIMSSYEISLEYARNVLEICARKYQPSSLRDK